MYVILFLALLSEASVKTKHDADRKWFISNASDRSQYNLVCTSNYLMTLEKRNHGKLFMITFWFDLET